MPERFIRLLVIGMVLLHSVNIAKGKPWISEYARTPRNVLNNSGTEFRTVPAYIEISGINPTANYELVVINSTATGNFGLIRNVVNISSANEVQIITHGIWPNDVFPKPLAPADIFHESISGDPLTFNFTIGLQLFEGSTGAAINTFLPDINDLPANATLVDSLSFGQPGTGISYDNSIVYDSSAGDVIAFPDGSPPNPQTPVIIGDTDEFGAFLGVTPVYRVNPGALNKPWPTTDVPEPAVVAIAATSVSMMLLSRSWRGRA